MLTATAHQHTTRNRRVAEVAELAGFYKALYASEMGHYRIFLKLAFRLAEKDVVETPWREMLAGEARIHSGI
jgi:tRNA isopentenyl-2-thiomethyl-A-37 hydroxylase MiaE